MRIASPLAALFAFALSMSGLPAAFAQTDTATDTKTTAYEASEQPGTDSWITTKVKADLLITEEVKGLDINVTTTNGVVTLSGRLDNQAQVDKAIAIAKAIKGVTAVDSKTLTVKPAK
ncbi:BON domain-containing protein [Arenimonas oryziterrae]|uniref:Osmotically-inducible protein Y n=1 Tax=Arenimonas oryziterrae DSM 21050 = YC6267 TaxID=1121015 RepID=A0A091AWU2_9GAMM|nr:BON domain-containing protein [Arenimonas oryziterrae]KFN43886.1 hypothetical protein N789_08030 [Arenimonas oryziterrae DSM 21050 = YC6267]